MHNRQTFDLDQYIERIQNCPCFICKMVARRNNGNHIVYQDDSFIVFLNKYLGLYGYVLVAPIQHKEQVTGDFTLDDILISSELFIEPQKWSERRSGRNGSTSSRWAASREIATFIGILRRCLFWCSFQRTAA